MVGIKDVAKLAGVSHGTISNVLKGDIYVSPEKVRKVKNAIKELGYTPNIIASRLKSELNRSIGLILPNVDDPNFSMIYKGIERVAFEKDYQLSLMTTNEDINKEDIVIMQLLQLKICGLIIITCQPENVNLFRDIESKIKLIFLERKVKGGGFNFIQFNNYKLIYENVLKNLKNDLNKILLLTGPKKYSNEKHCINAYRKAFADMNMKYKKSYIRNVSISKENSFVEIINFLKENLVDCIYTTSSELLEGVLSAIFLLNKKPKILSLSEYKWSDNKYPGIVKIQRNSLQMGEIAANRMIQKIEDQKENNRFFINIDSNEKKENIKINITHSKRKLKILMSESEGVYKLLPDFESKYGIKADIDTLPYDMLYKITTKDNGSNDYDIYSVGIEWLAELVIRKRVLKLNQFIENDKNFFKDFDKYIINLYSKYKGNYYALPFILDAQNLFYRKDLFEDLEIKSQFFKQNKRKLEIPKTWEDSDRIARFFTKKFNETSPVEYGLTLSNKSSIESIWNFLPRLWSTSNSKTFIDEKQLFLNPQEVGSVLMDYKKSFKYATISSTSNSLEKQIEEFNIGNAAMTICWYSGFFSNLSISHREMVNKIGCEALPGNQSILGGWVFVINTESKIQEEAFNYINWIIKDISMQLVLLDGISANSIPSRSLELRHLFPYTSRVFESIKNSNRLNVNLFTTNGAISQNQYGNILGEMIMNIVNKDIPIEKEVEKANNRIKLIVQNRSQ